MRRWFRLIVDYCWPMYCIMYLQQTSLSDWLIMQLLQESLLNFSNPVQIQHDLKNFLLLLLLIFLVCKRSPRHCLPSGDTVSSVNRECRSNQHHEERFLSFYQNHFRSLIPLDFVWGKLNFWKTLQSCLRMKANKFIFQSHISSKSRRLMWHFYAFLVSLFVAA